MALSDLINGSLIDLLPFALALLATGAVAGVLAGLLGVGGGIVIVPVLFNLLPFLGVDDSVLMHVAVGTSLATIIPTSIISARSHHKRGGLDMDLLKSLGPLIFVGVVLGTLLGGNARGEVLTGVFAVVALLVAANMAFRREGMVLAQDLPTGPLRWLLGVVIGGFSVMMGIGGGTASAIGLVIGVPGALGFILAGLGEPNLPPGNLGYANLIGVALIIPMTMMTAPLGAKIAHTINPAMLRKAFAFFLLLTALRMGYSLIGG
jgi:uncharacterized membrane protein YfcA